MYSIIYWIGDNECYPLANKNGTLYIAETLKEADGIAELLEGDSYKLPENIEFSIDIEDEISARVISISSVNE